MIVTLETQHGRAIRDVSPLQWMIQKNWTAPTPPPWTDVHAGRTSGKVPAVVNHGRWIVDCPTADCSAAQLASDVDRRFVCVECGAGPYKVMWPTKRDEIEDALAARPAENRNWQPGETPARLLTENAERGC